MATTSFPRDDKKAASTMSPAEMTQRAAGEARSHAPKSEEQLEEERKKQKEHDEKSMAAARKHDEEFYRDRNRIMKEQTTGQPGLGGQQAQAGFPKEPQFINPGTIIQKE